MAPRWATSERGSIGLLGMRERVRQLRGVLTIDSAPGKGFRIDPHACRSVRFVRIEASGLTVCNRRRQQTVVACFAGARRYVFRQRRAPVRLSQRGDLPA